jgi:hypothetical protein
MRKHKSGDLIKVKDFQSDVPYGSKGIILSSHESEKHLNIYEYVVDFGELGIHNLHDFEFRSTKNTQDYDDRDRIKEEYETWVDNVTETCDWKTSITMDEVQAKYSEIALKYALNILESLRDEKKPMEVVGKKILEINRALGIEYKGNYNLFLDDIRHPYDAFVYTKDPDFSKLTWVVARSYNEFIKIIASNFKKDGSFPRLIAFDHDLSDEHYEHLTGTIPYDEMQEKTGMHCAKWLIDFCMDNQLPLPEYKVHSMNPAGAENIRSILSNYKKHSENGREAI